MSRLPATLWAYAAAATLCFGSAWWVHRHPESAVEASDGVPIFSIEPGSISEVSFDSPQLELSMIKRSDAAGSYWWVEGARMGEGEQAGPFAFKGGSSADRLAGMLEPPKARRVVEAEGVASRLEEYGLAPAQGELTLHTSSADFTLTLGTPEAGGRSSYGYLRASETLYLLERRWVDLVLEGDGRLMDRRLYLESSLTFVGAQATLLEPGAQRTVNATIDNTNPAQPVWVSGETLVNWVTTSFGLGVKSYVSEELWEGAEPVVEVRYEMANDQGFVVVPIRRLAGEQPSFLAKTAYTRAPVQLRASSVERLLTGLQVAP